MEAVLKTSRREGWPSTNVRGGKGPFAYAAQIGDDFVSHGLPT